MSELDTALDAVRRTAEIQQQTIDLQRGQIDHLLHALSIHEGHRDADISRRNHLGEQ